MLVGEYTHNIDDKGRLIIPRKLRAVGNLFVASKGLDGCIFIFPKSEWEKFQEKLRTLPISNKNARTFTRFFLASAYECELDKQGRFILPDTLKEFAKIDKSVVVVGMDTRLEIWDQEIWKKKTEELSSDEIAENMEFLGI